MKTKKPDNGAGKPPPDPEIPPHDDEAPHKSAKSTKATVLQRVEEVLKTRLQGAALWEIREYAVEKAWNVSDTQLRRYIQQSDELLQAEAEADRAKLYRRHIAQRRHLLARALETGDLRTALAVVKDEAELEGLYSGEVERRLAALEQVLLGGTQCNPE